MEKSFISGRYYNLAELRNLRSDGQINISQSGRDAPYVFVEHTAGDMAKYGGELFPYYGESYRENMFTTNFDSLPNLNVEIGSTIHLFQTQGELALCLGTFDITKCESIARPRASDQNSEVSVYYLDRN